MFQVDWKVLDSSDRGTEVIARGSTTKDMTEEEIRQTLTAVLKDTFPAETAFSSREYVITMKEVAAVVTREKQLETVLRALMTNKHINLGDMIYHVRSAEGHGWDGPWVKAWSNAVKQAEELLR